MRGFPYRAWHAYLMLAVAALFWGGNIAIGRGVHEDIPPLALAFWRWVAALAALLPFTAGDLIRSRAAIRRQIASLVGLSAIGIAAFNALLYLGLNSTTAINGALVMALVPIAVPVFARLLWGDRLTRRQGLGIAVSLLGVAVLVTRAEIDLVLGLEFAEGDLWVFAAMLCWSFYSAMVKHQPPDLKPNTFLAALFVIAMPLLLPFYLWETVFLRPMPLTPESVLVVAYVGVLASVVAILCFNRAVAIVGPNRAGPFAHLVPVFATLFAVLFLDERVYPYHLGGMVLIACGIALATLDGSGRHRAG